MSNCPVRVQFIFLCNHCASESMEVSRSAEKLSNGRQNLRSRLKPSPFLSRSSKWRLRDDKSHDAESRNRECQLRRRSCDERAFSIDAFLFIYFWFWIHTASAPSTARTSTGGGAEIRKPWSATFEGTPAIHVSTLFGSRHSHSQIYKQTRNRTQHTSMKAD